MASFLLVSDESLPEYLYQGLVEQVDLSKTHLAPETISYISDLFCRHLRSEQLFAQESGHYSLPTLAYLYQDALNSQNPRDQVRLLQKLGDTAFFLAVLFPNVWLKRGLTEQYFHDMGAAAYESLSTLRLANALAFQELAFWFKRCVQLMRAVFHPPVKQFS